MGQANKTLTGFAKSAAGIGGIMAGIGAAFEGVEGIESFTDKLVELTKASIEAMVASQHLADSLGANVQSLEGIEAAGKLAGISQEQVADSFQKLQKSLAEAHTATSMTSQVLQGLGLSVKELANLPADQQFTKIAESISKIQNPTQRAQAEIALLGREGQKLDPLLRMGAGGIKAATDEAIKMGYATSAVDHAKVDQAAMAMDRMGMVLTGIGNEIAIGISPYIQALGDEFVSVATKGGGIASHVIPAIEAIAKAIAATADYLELLPAGWHAWEGAAAEATKGVIWAIDEVGSATVKLLNLLPGVNLQWTETFKDMEDQMDDMANSEFAKAHAAMDKFSNGDNAKAVTAYFDKLKAKSQAMAEQTVKDSEKMQGAFKDLAGSGEQLQKVATSMAEIQKEVSQFGLTDSQKKFADLKLDGANDKQLAQAKSLLDLKDQLEAISKINTDAPLTDYASKMEKLQQLYAQGKITADQFMAMRDTANKTLNESLTKSAEDITKSVQTPLEKYQEQLKKLAELLERGLITKDVFNKAKLQALQTLDTAEDKGDKQNPALMQAGSAAALEYAYNQSRGTQSMNKDQIARDQLKEQQTTNQILTDMQRDTHDMVTGQTQQFETLDLP